MTLGNYTLTSIETGRFRLDGGAMFGTVPKVLWEKKIPADQENRIELALRTLLIRGHGRTILVDTGMGTRWDAQQRAMYGLVNHQDTLEDSLSAAGCHPDAITDVLLTHLHFDHAGGATRLDGTDLVPAFKNARYYVQEKNFKTASAPNEREAASYLKDTFMPLKEHNRLHLLDGETELFPGLFLHLSNGHTDGMSCIRIGGETGSLLYCADLIPTSAHIPLPWIMGYDIQPLVLLEEKRNLLSRAFEENWILFFEHDPLLQACKIRQGRKYFEKSDEVRI